MTLETVLQTGLQYYLVAFDGEGVERQVDGAQRTSERIAAEIHDGDITDVVLLNHGWQGDVPAAKDQYSRWIRASAECPDLTRVKEANARFRPLIVGVHWPSLPWGDEELSSGPASFAPGAGLPSPEQLIDRYAERIADTPTARAALQTIFDAARRNVRAPKLSAELRDAYEILNREAGLGDAGEGAAPGDDREPFDADRAYALSQQDAVSFGGGGLGGLLAPLRQLSFYKMKDRARAFGQSGGAGLLRALQNADRNGDVRFHLMGHSFGCIVVSAILAGDGTASNRTVDSVLLIQGALSLWSYCSEIPKAPGRAGYFHSIVANQRVNGPIVTTQSQRDTAVGRLYPTAAGVARQVAFAPGDFPKYGALGTFGARGPGIEIEDRRMLPVTDSYGFRKGTIYNLESSHIINQGGGLSGAHNDIARPEVAHAFWQAAYPT